MSIQTLFNTLLISTFISTLVFAEQSDKNYSILTDETQVKLVFDQCSRMTSPFRTGYRKLDLATVEKIERLLPQKLKEIAVDKTVKLEDYYRQYVGYELLRRKLVYVNAFHKVDIKKWTGEDAARNTLINNWRNKAINVCGGGMSYWGALYDSQTGRIEEILFNTKGIKKK